MAAPRVDEAMLLAYMRGHKLAVIATVDASLRPQSALMGVAVTDTLELVFDTLASSRKHANLLARPHAAATFSGPGERTLQFEGDAFAVSREGERSAVYREAYYSAWPDGRLRAAQPGIVYWAVKPRWARFCDFDGPLIQEFRWEF
jgi:pyridoxine/pyridoxamine 5'-phosphate oxidase